jgi:hypothetical protein
MNANPETSESNAQLSVNAFPTEMVPKAVSTESDEHKIVPALADIVQFEILARKLWMHLERVEIIGAIDPQTRSQLASGSMERSNAIGTAETLFANDGKNDKEIVAAIINQDINEMNNATMTLEEVLTSPRWERCGFVHDNNSHNPLDDFSHGGGLLAAKCLLYFLIR